MTIEPKQLVEQGQQAFAAQKYDQAASAFSEAASAYAALDDALNAAEAKNNLSVALLQAGKEKEAYQAAAGTEEVFAQVGDVKRQAMAFGNQAAALEALKKLDQALEAYERSAALFDEAGESEMRSLVLQSAAAIKLKSGKMMDSGPLNDRLGGVDQKPQLITKIFEISITPKIMIEVSLQVRSAVPQDQHQIANLMFFESHVHRHLDWRAPLDWLGSPFYWVIEENDRILAVFACPQDPDEIAWVRLFAHARQLSLDNAWDALWKAAQREIAQHGGATVALIAMHQWLSDLLAKNDFTHTQDIIMLEWKGKEIPEQSSSDGITIREMQPGDLSEVAELDAAAFKPLWQNPLDALARALSQATSATVLEDARGMVGYQISTANPFGAHLARLAVQPDAQRQGFGSLIVVDLIRRLNEKGSARLTVNTQSDNLASLALYKKMGFIQTGETFPVFCYSVSPSH